MDQMNRQWLLVKRPVGRPDASCFELVERPMPAPGPGEVLVRSLVLSVDPYMRGRMRDAKSYATPWALGEPMRAGSVGEVVRSEHDRWSVGDVVVGELDWADHTVVRGELTRVDPDLAPVSTAVGVLGMPGRTAWHGTFDVGRPVPGDTVVVSGAAGAVGSVVGQLAKRAGARVVGIAGGPEKCAWLTDELGFDAAVDYRAGDLRSSLAAAAPDGVDMYFDNVGGEVTDAVWLRLNLRARIVICGQIADYNATELPMGPRNLGALIATRATVQGILVWDWRDQEAETTARLGALVASGDLRYRETWTEGLEHAPDAFLGLFDGENIGKQVVRIAERGA
jgi:NADPH-dependent curcumin reductase CurA